MTTERIVFANILRGVGAISVLISHYIGIFWIAHPDVSKLMGVPSIANFPTLSFPLSLIAEYCIVFGQFGVGVFFIVSGLVIPFSLRNVSRTDFLVRRAMRIYPVYIIGFSFVILSLYALSLYSGAPFKFSPSDILAHFGVITRGPLGVDRIDGISWTLEVEIYFYLIMCALGSRVLNFNIRQYILVALVIAATAVIVLKNQSYLIGVQVASGLLLLLGTAYYSLISKRISTKEFWTVQASITILILAIWLGVIDRNPNTTRWLYGYLTAIGVFYACFAFRSRIKENPVLSHLSDISYPLYVVHALFGYAVMYMLVDNGFGAYSAVTTAVVLAYSAALTIHVFIEKPAMSWIKLSRRRDAITQE